MKTLRAIYHSARADFLERVRRYGFAVTLLATVYLGLAIVRGNVQLHVGAYRGVFNSAWVGLLVALSTSVFVSLAGFYLVKNTIERDRQTGVGQIIAASAVNRFTYLVAKLLSNIAVFSVLIAVMALAALLAQGVARESSRLDLAQTLLPFLLLALPALVFVAGLAVFFETVPWLRGGFGNAVYFGLWLMLFMYGMDARHWRGDFTGMAWVAEQTQAFLRHAEPGFNGGIGLNVGKSDWINRTFEWPGLSWASIDWWRRIYWVGVALALTALGAVWFDRFDSHRAGTSNPRRWRLLRGRSARSVGAEEAGNAPTVGLAADRSEAQARALKSLQSSIAPADNWAFGRAVAAELRLMWKGQPWYWHAGTVVLLIGGLCAPLTESREGWLPFTWLWPLLLWSALGSREVRHRTQQLVFIAPRLLSRQLPAAWMAGAIVAMATGAGLGTRLVLAGEWGAALGWLAGAMFIPASALAAGVWSGTTRLFEALFVVCWYIGPLQNLTSFNFMPVSSAAVNAGLPALYLVLAAACIGVACIGRHRQRRLG
jgi:hypothetical protein